MATNPDSRQIKKRVALPRLGAVAGASVETILDQSNLELNSPLRMSASVVPDAVLNFSSSLVVSADTANKIISPVKKVIYPALSSPTINFQTQALSNAGDFTITFPASTVGQYRHCAFTLNALGKIQAVFSAEAATEGALVNPGSLFVDNGLPLGYVTLQCTNVLGYFKTAGSATNIIENNKIFRFGSGASAGGSGIPDALVITVANNQISPANLTGLSFPIATVVGFVLEYVVIRSTATQKLVSIERFRAIYDSVANVWYSSEDLAGKTNAISLSVTPAGQVQYTTGDLTGSGYVGTIKVISLLSFAP